MPYFRTALIAIACLLLAACDFHLRGIQQLPDDIKTIYIQSDNNAALVSVLKKYLRTNQVTVVNAPDKNAATLRLTHFEQAQQLLSLTGGAQAGQYILNKYVTFSLISPTGKELIKAHTVQASRQYNSNATQILSAEQEKPLIIKAINEQLAQLILIQLSRVPASHETKTSTSH